MTESLIGYLKVTASNIRTLHRHLQGGQWFEDHKKLSDYYEEIDKMEDNVVETLLSIGLKDMNIYEASQKYKVLECRDYSSGEAFALVKVYFERLLKMFLEFKKEMVDLPDGVKSKFEEYEYWLHLESRYKLEKLLGAMDLSHLFNNN